MPRAITLPEIKIQLQQAFIESERYSVQEGNILIVVRLVSIAILLLLLLWGYHTYRRFHHKSKLTKLKGLAHPHHHPGKKEVVEGTKHLVNESTDIVISSLSVVSTLFLTILARFLNTLTNQSQYLTEFNVTVILTLMGVLYLIMILGPMMYISAKRGWKTFISMMILIGLLTVRVVFPFWSFIPLI